MVRRALSEAYRRETEEKVRYALLLRSAEIVGTILWVVGAILFFVLIYLRAHP